jgi:pyruvate/2-oxoglutarate dehydrogenase complex dihydrolipoamide acyltransferase (E2) component
MGRYVITVAEDDPDGTSDSPITVRVETEGDTVHVRELVMRAPEGSRLVPGRLPSIDLDLLVAAFGKHLSAADSRAAAHREAEASHSSRPAKATPAKTAPAKAPPAKPETDKTAPAPSRTVSSRRSARKAPARAAKDGGQSAASHLAKGRAYRRMPDPGELEAVYARIGSITGVAAEYGVPRHTAQGWFGRLRRG